MEIRVHIKALIPNTRKAERFQRCGSGGGGGARLVRRLRLRGLLPYRGGERNGLMSDASCLYRF